MIDQFKRQMGEQDGSINFLRKELDSVQQTLLKERESAQNLRVTLETRITEIEIQLRTEEQSNQNWEELDLERKAQISALEAEICALQGRIEDQESRLMILQRDNQ